MTTPIAARIAALSRRSSLSRTAEVGVKTTSRLGGQTIIAWDYSGGYTATGVFSTDLTSLREANPARDLTRVTAVFVTFGIPMVLAGPDQRTVAKDDQLRLPQGGGSSEAFRVIERETVPGGLASRFLLEVV